MEPQDQAIEVSAGSASRRSTDHKTARTKALAAMISQMTAVMLWSYTRPRTPCGDEQAQPANQCQPTQGGRSGVRWHELSDDNFDAGVQDAVDDAPDGHPDPDQRRGVALISDEGAQTIVFRYECKGTRDRMLKEVAIQHKAALGR